MYAAPTMLCRAFAAMLRAGQARPLQCKQIKKGAC